MEQINKYLYKADPGELVQIEFAPSGTAQCLISIALDSQPLETLSLSGPSHFSFQFSESNKESVLELAASFIEPTPNAICEVRLRADQKSHSGPTLSPATPVVRIKITRRGGPR